MDDKFKQIRQAIINDPANAQYSSRKVMPLYVADAQARIVLITQMLSRHAQLQGRMWDDPAGDCLRNWLGITKEEFYHSGQIAILPMDFYYRGKQGKRDRPPCQESFSYWHPRLLQLMPNRQLMVLVGGYAAHAYLAEKRTVSQTAIIRNYRELLGHK